MYKLAIVIPCYNEEKNIPLILKRFAEVVKQEERIKVILVNNGSTDGSADIFAELLPQYHFAELVNVKDNRGYGFGIAAGLRQADTKYIGWTHADMQTDPMDVATALQLAEASDSKKVYVKGSRKGRGFFDNFFTIGMSFFETIFLKCPLWEINAQPNIFNRELFQRLQDPPHDFSFDLFFYYMAKRLNYKIIRFPVLFPERVHGESSWNTSFRAKYNFIKRTVTFSLSLKKLLKRAL